MIPPACPPGSIKWIIQPKNEACRCLLSLRKTKLPPLDSTCPIIVAHLCPYSCCSFDYIRQELMDFGLALGKLPKCPLPFVSAGRNHLSLPTVVALSLQSLKPPSAALLGLSPGEQVHFGSSNMAFALLAWRCCRRRNFKRKILICRGVGFSQQGNISSHPKDSFFFCGFFLDMLALP